MNYLNFLKEIELQINRSVTQGDELSSIEFVIVINHFNDLTMLDFSVVDFLHDFSLENIYNSYYTSGNE